MRGDLFSARASLGVPPSFARQWFLDLEAHPERYRFGTHAGFVVQSGVFGEVGSRFQTREWFYGIPLTLRFEVTEVTDTSFTFRLLYPPLPVWGVFLIEPSAGADTALSVSIGVTAGWGRRILTLPPVRGAVEGQIQREVDHIKSSIEAVFSSREL